MSWRYMYLRAQETSQEHWFPSKNAKIPKLTKTELLRKAVPSRLLKAQVSQYSTRWNVHVDSVFVAELRSQKSRWNHHFPENVNNSARIGNTQPVSQYKREARAILFRGYKTCWYKIWTIIVCDKMQPRGTSWLILKTMKIQTRVSKPHTNHTSSTKETLHGSRGGYLLLNTARAASIHVPTKMQQATQTPK